MNDSLGHAFGDCLLQELAARIEAGGGQRALGGGLGCCLLQELAARIEAVAAQRGLVARGEGCEFLLMLPEINDATESETVAHSVVATLNAEFSALGHSLNRS